jgi:STIP1 family protein 1
MALLKLSQWDPVITDSIHAIELLPKNMKAYYYLAQAQIALSQPGAALSSALRAHDLCVKEIHNGGKGGASIGHITELVLRCKKEDWERREKEKNQRKGGLREEIMELLVKERGRVVREAREGGRYGEAEDLKGEYEGKIGDLKEMFEKHDREQDPKRRKPVPDWVIDDITFSVMVDPVVVSSLLFSSSHRAGF